MPLIPKIKNVGDYSIVYFTQYFTRYKNQYVTQHKKLGLIPVNSLESALDISESVRGGSFTDLENVVYPNVVYPIYPDTEPQLKAGQIDFLEREGPDILGYSSAFDGSTGKRTLITPERRLKIEQYFDYYAHPSIEINEDGSLIDGFEPRFQSDNRRFSQVLFRTRYRIAAEDNPSADLGGPRDTCLRRQKISQLKEVYEQIEELSEPFCGVKKIHSNVPWIEAYDETFHASVVNFYFSHVVDINWGPNHLSINEVNASPFRLQRLQEAMELFLEKEQIFSSQLQKIAKNCNNIESKYSVLYQAIDTEYR